jgi:hypothetical protein
VAESRERRARNQALFREVNEQILKLASQGDTTEFVCECSNTDCIEVVEVGNSDYERIRDHPTWFLIKHDHDVPEIERVVSEDPGYAVVEKFVAEEYMEETDPRSDGSPAGSAGT